MNDIRQKLLQLIAKFEEKYGMNSEEYNRRYKATTGINLSACFEKWGVDPIAVLDTAKIEFNNITVQQVKQILTHLPSSFKASEEIDPDVIEKLRETFGAARYKKVNGPWQERFMPPIVVSHNEHHVVMDQRKWKVQGSFPHVCHGGLSLLEVAVPFIELTPL